jgi:hypothetical protein
MDYLQQTIWDAVTVVSVSRNWILVDGCFVSIQDNAADKVVQIEAMGKIYKNSTITIPADSASSLKGVLVDPHYRLSRSLLLNSEYARLFSLSLLSLELSSLIQAVRTIVLLVLSLCSPCALNMYGLYGLRRFGLVPSLRGSLGSGLVPGGWEAVRASRIGIY